jgi:mono/diheme cytochrome c family protein
LIVGLGLILHGAAQAADLSVCIDKSSASAARDERVADAVAHREGVTLAVTRFDGNGGDDGVSVKQFKKLVSTRCRLVLGFPVDATDGSAPPGLMVTKPYGQSGFVLVVAAGSPARKLADLPAGTAVAVTYEAPPNLYFADHKNVSPDIQETDAETLKAVVSGADKAAMVWEPTVSSFLASTPGAAKLAVYPLEEPHARFNLVALYAPEAAADASRFQTAVADLAASGELGKTLGEGSGGGGGGTAAATDALPALYTAAQAEAGHAKYIATCQICHGNKLQGRVGPALKGPNFASAKAAFTVSDVFTIVSQNMPASQPGTLPHNDYVDIMAFLLQQNGYPAGQSALAFDTASASKVALRYHGE